MGPRFFMNNQTPANSLGKRSFFFGGPVGPTAFLLAVRDVMLFGGSFWLGMKLYDKFFSSDNKNKIKTEAEPRHEERRIIRPK